MSYLVEYFLDHRMQSNVFMIVWPTIEVPSLQDAVYFLLSRAPKPLVLSPKRLEEGRTVVLRASENPRIEFGCRSSTGNAATDMEEIVRVLKSKGIDASFSMSDLDADRTVN